MTVFNESFTFSADGEIDFVDLTSRVADVVRASGVKNGTAHVFVPHATGVIALIEFEPSLLNDIKHLLEKMMPRRGAYHSPSNANSYLTSMLLNQDRTLPVIGGQIILGTWQSLVFIETCMHPSQRNVIIQVIGE